MDLFSQGFVEILAAEQTPDNPNWFQGTADAVRQAARHFVRYDADYYLILAGDHLYRMDYSRAGRRARRSAAPTSRSPRSRSTIDDASAMGIFRFDRERPDRRVRGEADARAARRRSGSSIPPGATVRGAHRGQAVRRVDGRSTCSRATCCSTCSSRTTRNGLRPRDHSGGARPLPRQRVPVPRLLGRRRHRSTSFYDANIMLTQAGRAVQVLRSAPADLHAPALSAGLAARPTARCATRSSPRAATSIAARSRNRSSASARTSSAGAHDPPLGAARRRLLRGRR